ncbi:unnamed protein product [Phaeothamnion confervicola]
MPDHRWNLWGFPGIFSVFTVEHVLPEQRSPTTHVKPALLSVHSPALSLGPICLAKAAALRNQKEAQLGKVRQAAFPCLFLCRLTENLPIPSPPPLAASDLMFLLIPLFLPSQAEETSRSSLPQPRRSVSKRRGRAAAGWSLCIPAATQPRPPAVDGMVVVAATAASATSAAARARQALRSPAPSRASGALPLAGVSEVPILVSAGAPRHPRPEKRWPRRGRSWRRSWSFCSPFPRGPFSRWW